ncbi:hypothetical protein BV25DRAFT_1808086 [Artomyces pyxidatus]|uniref:Uncharacterized protein n=1 Tax=Artomyces pyxidatus TaxID=48021 RepID=A0ACB8STN7_9AGAM|nr:hypothetical protein BV25DRAFT_1808086 [Artomyces pyxidatus]
MEPELRGGASSWTAWGFIPSNGTGSKCISLLAAFALTRPCHSDTYLILDRKKRIVAALVSNPKDREGRRLEDTWSGVAKSTADTFERVRVKAERAGAIPTKSRTHRRGRFTAVASGVSYGGGQTRPGNLCHSETTAAALQELLDDSGVQRIAGFQSEALAAYFPRPYADMCDALAALHEEQPELVANFKRSAYPTATFNLGPTTVCLDHRDGANYPSLPCAITALGNFDADLGGHLYLWDLGIKIRFPAGSTILLPSAGIRHGNVPVQKGETRYSLTQYCAGGLMRWVRHGFRPARSLTAAARRALEGPPDQVWQDQLARLSTLETLQADREWLCRKEAARASVGAC